MDNKLEAPGAVPGGRKPNPYAPPEAVVEDVVPQGPAARKPISAWLVQLATGAGAVPPALGLFRLASWSLSNAGESRSWGLLLFDFGWRAAMLAVLLGAVIGVQRRTSYGRWLGLAFIGATFAVGVYGQFTASHVAETSAEAVGQMLGVALVFGLFAWWFHAFGFSAKARRYFLKATSDAGHSRFLA